MASASCPESSIDSDLILILMKAPLMTLRVAERIFIERHEQNDRPIYSTYSAQVSDPRQSSALEDTEHFRSLSWPSYHFCAGSIVIR